LRTANLACAQERHVAWLVRRLREQEPNANLRIARPYRSTRQIDAHAERFQHIR